MTATDATTRPCMIYDGDCGFCRKWIARWQAVTGERIEYLPYQEIGGRFPDVPRSRFEEAVYLIEPDGTITSGAHAVFRSLALGAGKRRPLCWPLWMYHHVPGMAWLSERAYRWVADHRTALSRLTRWA